MFSNLIQIYTIIRAKIKFYFFMLFYLSCLENKLFGIIINFHKLIIYRSMRKIL